MNDTVHYSCMAAGSTPCTTRHSICEGNIGTNAYGIRAAGDRSGYYSSICTHCYGI